MLVVHLERIVGCEIIREVKRCIGEGGISTTPTAGVPLEIHHGYGVNRRVLFTDFGREFSDPLVGFEGQMVGSLDWVVQA